MSNSLRSLLEKEIKLGYTANHLDELNTRLINWNRASKNETLLSESILKGSAHNSEEEFNINRFLCALTDEELISVYTSQCCQWFR